MTDGSDRTFQLDQFQLEAIEHLDAGRSVIVSAPTGSGKTVVAEHAVDRAIADGRRAFYTTPIKALSNQKYRDLANRIGASRVGLLTGDNAINPDADVVVMTTEVLRNMLYENRNLDALAVTVLDEVHYLEDSFRGPVWEEVILHLPAHVTLVCLSATVSNSEEVGGWLTSVRGETAVVVETTRPVELTHLYAVGDRRGDRLHTLPTLVDGRANEEGSRFDPDLRGQRGGRGNPKRKKSPWRAPSKIELIDQLDDRDLLPLIWFVFSRKGCDEAASALAKSGARYTTHEEAQKVRLIAEERLRGLDPADLRLLDTDQWLQRLERGIASHHAGLVPAFKEAVEICFAEGLVQVVFATETLALGVNLPARSVVIDKLTKFTGDGHELLTPAQFTQLTGRAGRRGIDDRGTAVVPWSPFTPFDQVASLAGSRAFKLRSAFRPTYNMAANLLQQHEAEAARALLARSFAQYQADAGVARLEERLVRERQRVADLRDEVEARFGDEPEPDAPDIDPQVIADAVSRLRPGDVILDENGDRLAVLGVSWRKGGRARMRLVGQSSHEFRWELAELEEPPITVGHIELPQPMAPERIDYRNDVAAKLRRMRTTNQRRKKRARQRDDPRAALSRAEQEVTHLERRARRDQGSVARRFDMICEVLRERGHLDGWTVTERGRTLGRVYHENDLLVADAVDRGLLDGLSPPELASVVSSFTYEHRKPTPPPEPWFPAKLAKSRFREIEQLHRDISSAERRHGAPASRAPEAGFAPIAHAWTAGEDLSVLLDTDDELTAGDFVRNIKQLIDLLRQIAQVAGEPATARSARSAADAIHRGVVALSGSVEL